MPDALFDILNDTHHTVLQSIAEIFNIITKDSLKNNQQNQ